MLGLSKIPSQSHDTHHQARRTAPIDNGIDLRIAPLRLPVSAQTPQGAPSPLEPNTLLAPFDSIAPGLTIALPDPGASISYHPPAKLPTLQELISAARKHPADDANTVGETSATGMTRNGISEDDLASRNPMKELPLTYSIDDIVIPGSNLHGGMFQAGAKSLGKEISLGEHLQSKTSTSSSLSSSSSSSPPATTEGYGEMRRFLSLDEIAPPYKSCGLESIINCSDTFINEPLSQSHLQLPVPRTQQNTKKHPSFGPLAILNGLHEPPPDAGLFPPIDSQSTNDILTALRYNDSCTVETGVEPHGAPQSPQEPPARQERSGKIDEILDTPSPSDEKDRPRTPNNPANDDELTETETMRDTTSAAPALQPGSTKSVCRPAKRRWTDQETDDLLRGVVRCGVGSWKAILEQPDLDFTGRTALNLKDRFRVCCPWVYGGDSGKDHGHMKDRIQSIAAVDDNRKEAIPKSKDSKNPKKSRLTLIALGIDDPTMALKPPRRARRHFTQQEDLSLVTGFKRYGFRWATILNDKELKFFDRKPSDLRDRFRTKYPEVYKRGNVEYELAFGADGIFSDGSNTEKPSSVPPGNSSQESGGSSHLSNTKITPGASIIEPLPPISSLPFDDSDIPETTSGTSTAFTGWSLPSNPFLSSLDEQGQPMEWMYDSIS
ncbi:hypothetical protein KEM56_001790 [Ascosphaera pollenicola]|nr:hypothetical protein KEM56_001790 [Ascosphaera pollenicola]